MHTLNWRRLAEYCLTTLLFVSLAGVVFLLVTARSGIVLGVRSFVVLTGSMEPEFPVGSVVLARPQPSYELGDAITFSRSGSTVTHRIISRQPKDGIEQFVVKGDANDIADKDLVAPMDVMGKVFFMIPLIGRLIVLLKQPIAFVVAVIVPGIVFIIMELWHIKQAMEQDIEKKIRTRLEAL